MFCTECGEQLLDDAAFCIGCGAAVVEPEVEAEASQPDDTPFMWGIEPSGETVLVEPELVEDFVDVPEPYGSTEMPIPTVLEEPEPVSARLRLDIEDAQAGHQVVEFELADGRVFIIGRDGHVTDYVPQDPRTSRRHFSISVGPEGFVLEDLGSSNGTFVNGTRAHVPLIIRNGDVIEFGRSRGTLTVVQEPDPWPTTAFGLFQL